MKYFRRYLQIAPMTLAVWRSAEAEALAKYQYQEPLLDLGCGFGEFSSAFFEQPVGWGLDIDRDALYLASKKKIYRHLTHADARQMPYPLESFQTVLAMSVLEHIDEVERVFAEVFRVLQPGGKFIFSVPTTTLNDTLLGPHFLKRLHLPWLAEWYLLTYHRVFQHVLIMDQDDWRQLALAAGFSIQDEQPALSQLQVRTFELTLPLALPGRVTQALFAVRNPFPWQWRQQLYERLLRRIVTDPIRTSANVVFVLEKPRKTKELPYN